MIESQNFHIRYSEDDPDQTKLPIHILPNFEDLQQYDDFYMAQKHAFFPMPIDLRGVIYCYQEHIEQSTHQNKQSL
jgi:hypothetical protein